MVEVARGRRGRGGRIWRRNDVGGRSGGGLGRIEESGVIDLRGGREICELRGRRENTLWRGLRRGVEVTVWVVF